LDSRASNGVAGRRVLFGDDVIITNRRKLENPDFWNFPKICLFLKRWGRSGNRDAIKRGKWARTGSEREKAGEEKRGEFNARRRKKREGGKSV